MKNTIPTVTISEAKTIIACLAHRQSVLLLSAPGVGKSDAVRQAAKEFHLQCKSLLGTQIAPEDVSGIPRIVGERSVFCPPRILLPETPDPFCLFLDELPACSPDVQKAFYSLLLERRIGEYDLPKGTWVVAAGNRIEDRALVRSLSTALINRVVILHVTVDVNEWVAWARDNGVRDEIMAFILFNRDALQRPIPETPEPFSTPRSWAQLSQALDQLEEKGQLDDKLQEVLAYGTVSPQDAAAFTVYHQMRKRDITSLADIIRDPKKLPSGRRDDERAWRLTLLQALRRLVEQDRFRAELGAVKPAVINKFLSALSSEERVMIFMGCVAKWGALGADDTLVEEFNRIARQLA
ncbi:MAG: AAA family ATPase [Victivallales bacterium]|nr:AAA family ATPase [Victivallales bacterium]